MCVDVMLGGMHPEGKILCHFLLMLDTGHLCLMLIFGTCHLVLVLMLRTGLEWGFHACSSLAGAERFSATTSFTAFTNVVRGVVELLW